MDDFWRILGAVAGGAMPLFNIPLVVRIWRRKSCEDLSLAWVFGIWGCIVLMFPSSIRSDDWVLKIFGISNLIFFSMVVVVVVYFRSRTSRRNV